MNEIVIHSSASEFKRFIDSSVWRDILNELTELENMENAKFPDEREIEEIYRIQGRLEVLRDIKVHIPNILEALLEDESKPRTETKED